MQRLEVSGAVWPIYGSLGVKRLRILLYVFFGHLQGVSALEDVHSVDTDTVAYSNAEHILRTTSAHQGVEQTRHYLLHTGAARGWLATVSSITSVSFTSRRVNTCCDTTHWVSWPTLVAVRSDVWMWGRLIVRTAGSKPADGIDGRRLSHQLVMFS